MKTKSLLFRLDRLLVVALCAFSHSAMAGDLYWDANGGSAGTGGTGTWTTANTWRTNTATGNLVSWPNSGDNDAYFEGTAGTVTVGATAVTLGTGTAFFNTTGYTLTTDGASARTLTANLSIGSGLTLNVFGSGVTAGRQLNLVGSVSGGTLVVTAAPSTAGVTARLNFTGANSTISSALVLSNNAGLGTVAVTAAANNLQITGTVSIFGNAAFGGTTGNETTFTSGAVISGTGNLYFAAGANGGAGAVIINSQSTYTGETRFNQAASGVVRLGTNNALSTNSAVVMGFSSGNGGILDLNGFNQTFTSLASGAGSGSIRNSGASTSTLSITGSANTTFGLIISNAAGAIAFSKSGTGTITLTNANTFTGGTTLSGGGITLSDVGTLGGSGNAVTVSGGTLNLGGSTSVTNASLTISGGTLTNGTFNAPTYNLNGGTVAGNLGAGTINAGGSTALNGTAAATTVNITNGTLTLGSADRLADGAGVSIAGGTLAMGANNDTVGSLTISTGTLSGSGILTASTYALNGGTITGNLGAGTINVGGNAALNGTAAATVININSGTLTLGSGSRFTGTTPAVTMAGGTLALGGNETIGSLTGSSGTVALGANTLTVGGANTSTTYSSGITGTGGGLTKAGNGTLTLAANTSYTGTTTINGGTLVYNSTNTGTAVTVNSGGTLSGSGSAGATTINSGGTMNPGNSPGTQTYASLTWEGGGNYNWQLYDADGAAGTGYDTFNSTGAFTINATSGNKFNINLWTLSGIDPDENGNALNFSAGNNYTWTLGTFSSISGFSADAFTINTGAFNGTGGFANTFGAGVFSIDTNATSLLLVYTAPVIEDEFDWSAGNGNWSAGGNWTNNAAPPATGAKIYFSGAGGLSTNNVATSIDGLTFRSGAGAYTVEGDAVAIGAFGVVNESTALQTVDLNLTLAASQAFNAASGNLAIGGSVALGANTLTVTGGEDTTISGAISGSGGLVKTGAGDLTLSGANNYTGGTLVSVGGLIGTTTSLQGGITNNASVTFSQSTNGTYGGVMSGTGSLTKTGSGSVTLAGNSTFSGILAANGGALVLEGTQATTTVNVDGGTILLGANNVLADGATLTLTTGTVDLGGFSDTVATFNQSGGVFANGTLTATIYGLSGGTVNGNFGTGTINVSANTALNGTAATTTVNITGGTLTLGSASRLTGTTPTVNLSGGGALALGGNESIGALNLTNGTVSGTGTLTVGSTIDAQQGTVSANLAGSAGLTKTTADTVTLSGANTFSGAVAVNGGTLVLSGGNALANTAAVTVGNVSGATLQINNNETIGSLAGGGASGGVLALGANTLTLNQSGNTTYAGTVTGAGLFQKTGAGTLTFSTATAIGADFDLQIDAGTVDFNRLAALSGMLGANNKVILNGGTFQLSASNNAQYFTSFGGIDVIADSVFSYNRLGTTASQGPTNTVNLTFSNDARLSFAYSATITAGNTLFNGTANVLHSDGTINTTNYSITVGNGFSETGGARTLTKEGAGTLVLGGTSTYTGDTVVQGGVMSLANNASISESTRITVAQNARFNFTNQTRTVSGISGAGTIGLGSATLTVSNSVNQTFSGDIVSTAGAGLTKAGNAVLTLSGASANTFAGMTTVSAGTLELNKTAGVNAIAGAVTVNSGAALLLSSSGNVANASAVTLSGGTITRASGVSEVFGNLNLTGASSLDFGLGDIGTLSFGTYTASALLTVQNFLPGNKLQFATGFNSALLPTGGELSNANFSFSNGFTTGTEGDYFTITAIPEPSTYAAAAGLLAMMLWPARRRLLKDVKSVLGLRAPMRDRLARSRQ